MTDTYDMPGADDEDLATDQAGMTEDEFQSVVGTEIEDAIIYIDSDIAPLREKATLYYKGAPFGNEEDGRSQVVSRDVHDVVSGTLPSLMRVFFGPEKVVEFAPNGEQDVDMAEQATDYINYIVMRDNPGFSVFWNTFKDALIRKCGFIKYYWDNSVTVSRLAYTGLDGPAISKLQEDLSKAHEVAIKLSEDGMNVEFTLKKRADKAVIQSIPPEEYVIDRHARSPTEYTLKGHRRIATRSELIALGYSPEDLDDLDGDDGTLNTNAERQARLPTLSVTGTSAGDSDDESQNKISYFEGFVRVDKDGDGIAELRRICAAGSGWKILHDEQVEDDNFAEFPSDPEPHTFFGDCPAEKVMDVQKIKSGVLRASLDSLSLSIYPRAGVIEGQVNIADAMNTEMGALIRMQRPDAYVPFVTPFVGKEAFPMLAYMDEVRESRTGMSKTAQGLEPGALQNMTALAAANQFNKAHEHIEIIARIFAETGMKRLFGGLLRLVTENQRQQRMINLRNKWVPVDPRAWKANMEVTCNVALGAGTNKEKLNALATIAAKQEQIILAAGPNNPLCGIDELHNTYTEMTALAGFKNPTKYWKDPSTQQQVPQQPPPPDPNMIKAQNEQLKIQSDHANKQADRQQALMLGLAEINARYQTTIDAATIKAQAETMRVQADLVIQASEAHHQARLQEDNNAHQMQLARQKSATMSNSSAG